MRLIIHAPFIYSGGGRTLLEALLNEAAISRAGFTELLVLADRRFSQVPILNAGGQVLAWVDPTVSSRLRAERTLARTAAAGDVVLCLANLPPLFRTRGFVVTYVQNTYLASTDPGVRLPWHWRVSVLLQRTWLAMTRSHADLFAVQTTSMRDRLVHEAGVAPERVVQLPFMRWESLRALHDAKHSPAKWDFGYVSLPWPHKNHRRLIEAFVLLAETGLTPSLVLTVPESMDRDLAEWITCMTAQHRLRITNLGAVPLDRMSALYRSIGALIFPSLSESFALPLLEAREARVPILAPERDYVRDVVVPAETFDPESPRSIMRAILRFLGKPEEPAIVPGPDHFLSTLYRLARDAGRTGTEHGDVT